MRSSTTRRVRGARHTIRGGDACRSMPGLLAAVLAAASFAVAVQSCGDHRGPTYTGFDAGSRQLDGEIEFHLSNRAVGGGIITPDAAAAHHALLATWRPIPDGAAPPLRALGFLEMKSQAGLLTFRKRSAIAGSAAELGCRAAPEGELVRRAACLAGTLVCGVALVAVAGAVARLHAYTRTFPSGGVVGLPIPPSSRLLTLLLPALHIPPPKASPPPATTRLSNSTAERRPLASASSRRSAASEGPPRARSATPTPARRSPSAI